MTTDHHFLTRLLGATPGEPLDPQDAHILHKIELKLPIARDAADVADEQSTLGERLADQVAAIGGSWGVIAGFSVVLFGWMLLNSGVLERRHLTFDPYPFIFLNLMLSTLAAIQAPVIMMSQNRQAAKDRVAASLDYEVNLRAELEILRLHEKIDMAVAERLDRIEILLVSALAPSGRPGSDHQGANG